MFGRITATPRVRLDARESSAEFRIPETLRGGGSK